MTRLIPAAALLAVALSGPARADDAKDATAVLDKAIKALGGEDKLSKAKGTSVKVKATLTFMGMDIEMELASTVKGVGASRSEFAGSFGGMDIRGVTVLAGGKGWQEVNGQTMEMPDDRRAAAARELYMNTAAVLVLPLKGKGFKTALAGEEKVDGKPAAVVQVTDPDGNEFKVFFDKASGLPVRTAGRVAGFDGAEAEQVATYSEFKEMGGIKRATKLVATRDGEKFATQQVTEFKLLEMVDDKLFEKP